MTNPKGLDVASRGRTPAATDAPFAALQGCETTYGSTDERFVDQRICPEIRISTGVNRNTPFAALTRLLQSLSLVYRKRPDFVVGTGAALNFSRRVMRKTRGAITIWVDDLSNSEFRSIRPAPCIRRVRHRAPMQSKISDVLTR